MPRGRPKALPKIEPTELDLKIAEYISKYLCSVPGCVVSLHIQDARDILALIKEVEK